MIEFERRTWYLWGNDTVFVRNDEVCWDEIDNRELNYVDTAMDNLNWWYGNEGEEIKK